jgi:hypothetical protein
MRKTFIHERATLSPAAATRPRGERTSHPRAYSASGTGMVMCLNSFPWLFFSHSESKV